MKTLAIIGAGHLGQQIAHFAITDGHFEKVIFFDDYTSEAEVNGIKVGGKTNSIVDSFNNKMFDEIIIGIGYNHMESRKEFFQKFYKHIPFANIIHSSNLIDESVSFGVGNILYPGSVIDAKVEIKDNILINIGCSIAHDTIIHSHCFISPRVALAGFIEIGERSILGINSTIIDNIKIAAQVQIGGGTVVIKNIEKSGIYVGNPARIIRPNNDILRDNY
jgi:sugar O-acyltransferase (sialic acid O-acetyltransferase NeuD family)